MIKILLECFNFIKQLIESNNKKDFISKNTEVLKNCLIILLGILLLTILILYIVTIFKKASTSIVLPNNNGNIIIHLEVPTNINGPITLKLSKSS